jgi:hypothetical protein
MFIGHFAVGFAAKRAAPRTSLTMLITAAIFLDVLWPVFLWLGLEKVRIVPGFTAVNPLDFVSYPYSHSMLAALGWAAVVALVYRACTRYATGAVVVGLAVFSHWVLDFVSHTPDLPLAPGLPQLVGLGLWNSVPATGAVEGALFVAGLALYLGATRARGWAGHVSLWSIVGLLTLAYVGNLVGPPPPSVGALRVVSTAMLLLMFWFVWVDRTRAPRASPTSLTTA